MVKTFILDASYIPSRSMMDVLQPGDFVLVNKFLYGPRTPPALSGAYGPLPTVRLPALRDPRRGDILVFWFPSEIGPGTFRPARHYVKRCIAVPGDTLVVDAGIVSVNGRTVVSLEGDTLTRMDVVIPRPGELITTDAGAHDTLGELVDRDREVSAEAAGSPGNATARGTAHMLVNEFYFVLGDRTSLSVDSRHWGFIPRAWVIGTPIAVYWSVEPGAARAGFWSWLQGVRWSRIGQLVR